MAANTFNVSHGRVNEYHNRVANADPATCGIIVVLLQTSEAAATLLRRATLAEILANNTEATFTGYGRITYTSANVTAPTVDNVNDWQSVDFPDPVWSPAGGVTNNTTTHLITCYAADTAGADSTIVPMTLYDFVVTTDGTEQAAVVDPAGYFRARALPA